MGRPPKLNADLQEQIVLAIREDGLFHKDAAAIVGIDEKTFSRWFTAGAHEDAKPLYRAFYLAVCKAEADFKHEAHKSLKAASASNPKFLLSFLGRRFPAQYGRKDNVEDRSAEDRAADQAALRETLLERVDRLFAPPPAEPGVPDAQ